LLSFTFLSKGCFFSKSLLLKRFEWIGHYSSLCESLSFIAHTVQRKTERTIT
jgi:hypothetical protein